MSGGDSVPKLCGVPTGIFVLCLLVFQNAGAVLLMRAVRAVPGQNEFVTQTAVLSQEFLKGLACMILMMREDGTITRAWQNKKECLKTGIPALLYLIQNNLQYVAATYLDAPTYAITYQTKMLWVALCSVLFLGKKLEMKQWAALCLLMTGVTFAQVAQIAGKEGSSARWTSKFFGMVILLLAALCSSLAAVSFEKLLKGVKVSLWTRNLQLAGFSILLGGLSLVFSEDGARVLEGGFFQHHTALTWFCICMNAFGGLLVGAVINYADAILKDVAIGASIVVAALGSSMLYEFRPSSTFIISVALVSYAVPMYAGRAYLFGQCDVLSLYKPSGDQQPVTAYLNAEADDVEIASVVGHVDAKK